MNNITRRSFLKTSAALAVTSTGVAHAQASASEKHPLEAGVAVRDITPPPGVPMWGYGDRKGPATRTLDPLYGRAVVLKSPEMTVAIATMDLGRVPMLNALNRIRDRVKAKGIDHVVFTSSHTHGGPIMEDEEAPHCKSIEDALGACIEDAAKNLRPVRIGIGKTSIDISHNRRKILQDGRCLMMWRNEKREPTVPVDHEASIIKVEGYDGVPLAILVHYACHPVVLGPDNLEYTADYVGEMTRLVKQETGADCFFLQGGCGDINPYLDKTPRNQDGVEAMRGAGKACADAVLKALGAIETHVVEDSALAIHEKSVEVGTRWDFSNPDVQNVLRGVYGPRFDSILKQITPELPLPLTVLLLNREIALAFVPGEFFVQYQLDLKTGAPVKHALLVGYANDFHAYFPTIGGAAAGGYGGTMATYVGVGAGDKFITEARIAAGKLAGRIRDTVEMQDFKSLETDPTGA
ncbi:MAG: hypothetical protein K1Y02_14465 [Candidatus Hydrogenedentes bacterium]|nr:hypothetical protein [Candidatus Hydrogenedentota bacterium]